MILLEEFNLGSLRLKNRMMMSSMTRSRADKEGVVGEMTVQYYRQRARYRQTDFLWGTVFIKPRFT